jgi:hypothetical protein
VKTRPLPLIGVIKSDLPEPAGDLEALFALFRFEPRTRADAEALLRFIGDDPEAFETWRSIADDDEHATFRGALAKAMLSFQRREPTA